MSIGTCPIIESSLMEVDKTTTLHLLLSMSSKHNISHPKNAEIDLVYNVVHPSMQVIKRNPLHIALSNIDVAELWRRRTRKTRTDI